MLKEIPEEIQLAKGSPFEPFSSSFGISEESNRVMDYLTSGNYRYFEIDIDAGIHIVKVMYSATFWINNSEWVKERSFRYALSPAKYWQSYGTLDITINSTEFKKSYTTSLGSPSEQSSPTLAHWHFMSLPEEDIIISYTPEVSLFATIMIAIGPFGLGSLLLLIAIMLHGCVIKRYRRHDVTTRLPWVVIVGSLIIPLFVLISIIGFFPLIDICIGTEAGGHHGYTFLIILLYPVIALLYWLIMWFYDWMLRRKTKG
ncbi:hypothetical protein [Williamwhitmania taraxaci]|uniref:Uncharacterized protein n=1 Tax=Williamwhitmania taraxaci TaxID=1640674 RepID=A0A1G6GTR2_9BACT|nr:hypothetical protein [Williamwhitmania taraxaci]SDB85402.1 hypothetical protein SAMN05216323_100417 [Williamwhitmania taraxaci]